MLTIKDYVMLVIKSHSKGMGIKYNDVAVHRGGEITSMEYNGCLLVYVPYDLSLKNVSQLKTAVSIAYLKFLNENIYKEEEIIMIC